MHESVIFSSSEGRETQVLTGLDSEKLLLMQVPAEEGAIHVLCGCSTLNVATSCSRKVPFYGAISLRLLCDGLCLI